MRHASFSSNADLLRHADVCRRCLRPDMAATPDQADRADRTRCRNGCHGAAAGRRRQPHNRTAGGGREHAGRIRHPGASSRRARGARRLHAALHQHLRHGDQPGVVQATPLQSGARLHAGRHGLQPRSADAVGKCPSAGPVAGRVRCLRQGEPRQALDRLRHHRRRGRNRRQAAEPSRRSWPGRSALSIGCADDVRTWRAA